MITSEVDRDGDGVFDDDGDGEDVSEKISVYTVLIYMHQCFSQPWELTGKSDRTATVYSSNINVNK